MLPGLLVYRQTGVNREAAGDENRGVRLAAQQLLESDPYAKRSRIRRMSDFAKNLLKKKRSVEDYELAIEIAIAQGHYDEALAFQEKELDVLEGGEEELAAQYLRMGCLYVLLGAYEKALNWLDLGVAVTPTVEAVLTRAQVKLNLGDASGAVQDADACLKAVGEESALLRDLVNTYEAAGAYETAIRLWTRLIGKGSTGADLLHRAYCYMQLGRIDEAERDAETLREMNDADSTTADTMLALGCLRSGSYERARQHFEYALSGTSDPTALYYYLALCASLTGDHERVCEYGERLIQKREKGEAAAMTQFKLEDATGRLHLTLKPVDYAQLCRMVGSSYLTVGSYKRAVEVLTISLQEKDDPAVRYLRGTGLLAESRWREALEDYAAAQEAGVKVENCIYSAGVCRMQLGEINEAITAFAWIVENSEDASLREEAARQKARLEGAG